MNTRLLNSQPWRFVPGDQVYVRGWPIDETALVIDQQSGLPFPHYLVVDGDSTEWRISQLELSRKPIYNT
jgi:hypothetical protein